MSNDVWDNCRQQLKNKVAADEYDLWINPLQAQVEQETLTLYAPNDFVEEHVQNNYLNLIRQALASQSCPLDPIIKKGSVTMTAAPSSRLGKIWNTTLKMIFCFVVIFCTWHTKN